MISDWSPGCFPPWRMMPPRRRNQLGEALELIDKLEQDEDVQNVYHTLD
jgi:transcriptional/translational regulatory protein YebC/TACO1